MKFTNSFVVGCALAAPIAALPARNSNGVPDNSRSQATPAGRLHARQANEINALLSAVPAVETALGLAKRNPQDIVLVSGTSTSTVNFSGATVTPTTIVLAKRQAGVTISGLSGSALSALATATGSAGSVLSGLATATPTVSVGRRQVAISGSAIDSLLSGSGVGTIAVSGVATPSVSLARRQQGGASTPVSSSDISAIEGVLGDLLGGVVKRQSSGQGQGSQGGNSQGSGSSGSSSSSSSSEEIAGATLGGYTLQLIDKRQNGGNGQGGNSQGSGSSGSSSSSSNSEEIAGATLGGYTLQIIDKRQNGGNGKGGNGQSSNGQSGNGQSNDGQSSNGQSGSSSSGSSSSGSSSSSTTQTEADILNDILKLINKRAVTLEARQFNASNIPGNLTNTTITISTK